MLGPDATVPVQLAHLRRVHGQPRGDPCAQRWGPVEGFTLAQDLDLVSKHQADHESGRAFTFVLLTPSRSEVLGCVYLTRIGE